MGNFVNKLKAISDSYLHSFPKKSLYKIGHAIGMLVIISAIAFGVLCLIVGLKKFSIPGINAIHSHLDTTGTVVLGSVTVAGGILLLLGGSCILCINRQKYSIDHSHSGSDPRMIAEIEFTNTEDASQFFAIARDKKLGLFLEENGDVEYPENSHTYISGSDNVITVHLPEELYFTDTDNGPCYKGFIFHLENTEYSPVFIIARLKDLGFKIDN